MRYTMVYTVDEVVELLSAGLLCLSLAADALVTAVQLGLERLTLCLLLAGLLQHLLRVLWIFLLPRKKSWVCCGARSLPHSMHASMPSPALFA